MFKDKRGLIKDLLVNENASVTYITFKKGAVRGNHYHKKTTQMDVILSGKLKVAQKGYEKFGVMIFESDVVKDKNVIKHSPNEGHAYEALEDSEMISICWGLRKGKDYEKDTYKLKTPLL